MQSQTTRIVLQAIRYIENNLNHKLELYMVAGCYLAYGYQSKKYHKKRYLFWHISKSECVMLFQTGLFVSRVYGDTYWYLTAVELVSFGIVAIAMAAAQNFILYLAIMALCGIALTTVQTATTILPVGMAILGPMADVISLQWIMVGSGVALILITVYVRTNKNMYTYKR